MPKPALEVLKTKQTAAQTALEDAKKASDTAVSDEKTKCDTNTLSDDAKAYSDGYGCHDDEEHRRLNDRNLRERDDADSGFQQVLSCKSAILPFGQERGAWLLIIHYLL